jgi:hypothetical protein
MYPLPKEDLTKLHAEVNNYINQQTTLLISAISVVGVVLSWITQKADVDQPAALTVAYLGSAVLLGFIAIMALTQLRLQLAAYRSVAYLRFTGSSRWERDYRRFEVVARGPRWSRISSHVVAHGYLGAVAAAWPAVLAVVVFDANSVSLASAIHMGVAIGFVAVVFILIPWYFRRMCPKIDKHWLKVLDLRDREIGTDSS